MLFQFRGTKEARRENDRGGRGKKEGRREGGKGGLTAGLRSRGCSTTTHMLPMSSAITRPVLLSVRAVVSFEIRTVTSCHCTVRGRKRTRDGDESVLQREKGGLLREREREGESFYKFSNLAVWLVHK